MTENRFSLISSSSTCFSLCLLTCLGCALNSSCRLSIFPNDLFGLHIELSSTIGPQMAAHMTGTASGGSASPAAIVKRANKMALMAQLSASSAQGASRKVSKVVGFMLDRSKLWLCR